MRESLTLLILGAVFVASVINQLEIRRWADRVARLDPWTFLPFWAFFAPTPAHAGLHLIYRDRSPAGWTGWAEMRLPGSTGWRWLWNPGRFERKALHDLVNGLAWTANQIRDEDRPGLELTGCHLALLAWVMAQDPPGDGGETRQFALVQAVGHGPGRDVRPVYVSREYACA